MKPTAQRANRLSSAVGASLKGVFLGVKGTIFPLIIDTTCRNAP